MHAHLEQNASNIKYVIYIPQKNIVYCPIVVYSYSLEHKFNKKISNI